MKNELDMREQLQMINEANKVDNIEVGVEVKTERVYNKINTYSDDSDWKNREYKRGQIFYADLSGNQGSEQGNGIEGIRPICIIQNDIGNKFSPTVVVAVLTSKLTKVSLPVHVQLDAEKHNLPKNSILLFEQIRTLDKRRLKGKIADLGEDMQKELDNAVIISMTNCPPKSLLERLPTEMKEYVIATLKHIKKLEITVNEMKESEIDKDVVSIIVNKKLLVLNKFIKYCGEHQLDYKSFYIVGKGVNKEVLL